MIFLQNKIIDAPQFWNGVVLKIGENWSVLGRALISAILQHSLKRGHFYPFTHAFMQIFDGIVFYDEFAHM